MSIFRTRELWSYDLNNDSVLEGNSILFRCIGSLPCIFVSSHNGYLRAFSPDVANRTGFQPKDLVYETLFDSPVLQIQFASLVSGSQDKQLAVLHPRSIAIYHVQRTESNEESCISLKHAYSHYLHRSAHSFVCGSFGGVKGREFLCVQSLDGLLSFFEQESPTFETQLPDVLLPGPIRFLLSVDGFLLQDANLVIVCYSYEGLSHVDRKKITPYWSHNIGELVLDIQCLTVSADAGLNILILTERSLYNFDDRGGITWMKKFEFRPMCMHGFANHSTSKVMSCICTEFQTLQVYEATTLKWSAKLDFTPIQVATSCFDSLRGVLTLLSDCGQVSCVYLGTIPNLYMIPPTVEPDINIQQAEEELKFLQQEIKNTDIAENFVDDILSVALVVDHKTTFNEGRICCKMLIELTPQAPINKVQVFVIVEYPLESSVNSTVISSVCKKESIECSIYVGRDGPISNLDFIVTVSYISPNGIPRVLQKGGKVPVDTAITTCPASKEAPFKLTLSSNKQTCSLNELFPGSDGTANAVGIKFVNSDKCVSIIAAKTSQRYRIQAERVEDFTLVLETLVERLKGHFKPIPDFSMVLGSPIPLQFYFENIERHYELITRKRLKKEQLAQRCVQYRTIQKKVLVALKDLTPKPTSALHKVLDDTYSMMKTTIDELERLEDDLQTSRAKLSSVSRLIVLMLQLMTVKESDLDELRLAFCPVGADSDDQGWLEVQNATVQLLLRTSFAKSSKDQNKPAELTLQPLSDVARLCKNLSTIIDRATKGSSLVERAEFEGQIDQLPTVPSVKQWKEKEIQLVPAGSKLVDLSKTIGSSQVIARPEKSKDDTDSDLMILTSAQNVSPFIAVEAEVTIEAKDENPNSEPNPEEGMIMEDPPNFLLETKNEPSKDSHRPIEEPKQDADLLKKKTIVEDDEMWDLEIDEIRI